MPSLPSAPDSVLPPSRPSVSLNLPSPDEQVGGLGAAQEGRSIPARFCPEQPRRALGERGQGEVRAVAALVTGQDAGPGWAPNEEEGGRGGALGGRTLRVMRREEFGTRFEL